MSNVVELHPRPALPIAPTDGRVDDPGGRPCDRARTETPTSSTGGETAVWTCTWTTGPDAGGRVVLTGTRVVVGRAPGATVRCDDPALEPHHALLVVEGAAVRVVQLTGRAPLVVDGRGVDGPVVVHDRADLELGHSTLVLRQERRTAADRAHVRGDVLIRAPRQVPRWDPTPLTEPTGPPTRYETPAGLAAALCGAVAAVVLAVVIGQWMIVAFGLLGACIALGSWLAQRIGRVRRRRQSARSSRRDWAEHAAAVAACRDGYVEHVLTTTSTVAGALATLDDVGRELWSRRAADGDAFTVALGRGEIVWHPPLVTGRGDGGPVLHVARHHDPLPSSGAELLHDLPITTDLGPGARLAIRGDRPWTEAVAMALVVQLVANCGPADLRVAVVTAQPRRWAWLGGIPHACAPDGTTLVVDPSGVAAVADAVEHPAAPHVVVVTDAPELLAARTSLLRRLVAADRHPALLVLVPGDEPTPTTCSAELRCPSTSGGALARWTADLTGDDVPAAVRLAGIGARSVARATAGLGRLRDPDDPFGAGTDLPDTVTLGDLLGDETYALTAIGIAARWDAAGADARPTTPIGRAADGIVDVDLVRDGPHGLIAGTTGSGKSELLRSLVAGMAVRVPPEQLTFVLVDYKGGATFDACAELPHVVGVVTDLDASLAERMLRSLHAELRRRESVLRGAGAGDLTDLRAIAPQVPLARLVVVIDEFAALVQEQPTFLHALVGIAQRGRSLGVHLLLATQRPGGVLSDDIRANTNIRCALRLNDATDAVDVVGDAAPALIPRRLAGRAVLRLGPDEHVTFQTARCTSNDGGPSELAALVRAVQDAHRRRGGTPPPRPWCPPLPDELPDGLTGDELTDDELTGDADDTGPDVVGLVDDPDRQRRALLRWRPADGHLLVAGSRATGVTSTLRTLATAAMDTDPATHLYVVDVHGSELLGALADHPACAGVVRIHERERLRRLLLRLGGEVERRADDHTASSPVLLLVDGFTELREHLADVDTEAERAALERIVGHGARCGVVAVLATGQPGAVPASVLAHCPNRWVHHLVDDHDAIGWGFRPADLPPGIAGRVAVEPGLHAQLLRPPSAPRRHRAGTTAPASIDVLATDVDTERIGPGRVDETSLVLPIGLGFDTGEPLALDVADGEHVLVLGPARSGRTTCLARVVDAWQEAHPTGWSAVLCPRPRRDVRLATHVRVHTELADLLAAVPPDGPVLVAVDDAELVSDAASPSGCLAELAASRRPGLLVVAAGTGDALRQQYGHWTSVVRRSRLGLLLGAASDVDGDLVGAALPRRRPIPPRPGLAWLAVRGQLDLVQVARPAGSRTHR